MSPKVPPIGQSGAVSLDGALAGEGGAALQGEAQLIASNAAEELDGAATPAMLESAQLGEGDGGGASQMNGTSMTPGTTTMLAREYVWGPGDWGVDELLVQYDAARRATWPILDPGGDVIALCDLGGANNSAREFRTSKMLDTGLNRINGMSRHNMALVRNRYDLRKGIFKTLLYVSICA